MDRAQNILMAKKHIVENIYSSVKIEGLGMTFPETSVILENGKLEGKTFDEVSFVNDLKHAWNYLFDHIDDQIDLELVKAFNRISGKYTVNNAGSIRSIFDEPVGIRGSRDDIVWTPDIPPGSSVINDEIIKKYSIPDRVDAAVELYIYLAKGQFFNDGNKRVASLVCNMTLIQSGEGLFIVPVEENLTFKELLINYYITDDPLRIKSFIKDKCIVKPSLKTTGQKIQILRERAGISREEMAQIIGVSSERMYEMERDKNISEDVIRALAEYFEIEKEELIIDTI